MNVVLNQVVPNSSDYTLTLSYSGGEIRVFDVKPYLDKGVFKELRNKQIFNSVHISNGTVEWQNGQDFCPDTLYYKSVEVKK
jgi:hypothetical protein